MKTCMHTMLAKQRSSPHRARSNAQCVNQLGTMFRKSSRTLRESFRRSWDVISVIISVADKEHGVSRRSRDVIVRVYAQLLEIGPVHWHWLRDSILRIGEACFLSYERETRVASSLMVSFLCGVSPYPSYLSIEKNALWRKSSESGSMENWKSPYRSRQQCASQTRHQSSTVRISTTARPFFSARGAIARKSRLQKAVSASPAEIIRDSPFAAPMGRPAASTRTKDSTSDKGLHFRRDRAHSPQLFSIVNRSHRSVLEIPKPPSPVCKLR